MRSARCAVAILLSVLTANVCGDPPKSSWDFTSVTDFISTTTAGIKSDVAAITESSNNVQRGLVSQIVEKTKVLVEETKKKLNMAEGIVLDVYDELEKVPPRERTLDLMVEAFVTAISAELHFRMPPVVDLPDMELPYHLKYLCARTGQMMNLQTMDLGVNDFTRVYDTPIGSRIDVTVKYTLKYLHMFYKHFGERAYFTLPVRGSIDMNFDAKGSNEVEIIFEIPYINDLTLKARNLKPECLVSIKGFRVTRMALPKIDVEPPSAFRLLSEQMMAVIVKKHEDKFQLLVEVGVTKALLEMLKTENDWICKTKHLEESLNKLVKSHEEKVKPKDQKHFKKFCGDPDKTGK